MRARYEKTLRWFEASEPQLHSNLHDALAVRSDNLAESSSARAVHVGTAIAVAGVRVARVEKVWMVSRVLAFQSSLEAVTLTQFEVAEHTEVELRQTRPAQPRGVPANGAQCRGFNRGE